MPCPTPPALSACARPRAWRAAVLLVMALAGCAGDNRRVDAGPALRPADARALIAGLLPPQTPDAAGWATDIYAAFAALKIAPTRENVCSVVAIAEQESGLRADPAVPGLPAITWAEIDRRAERAGVPRMVVHSALRLGSPTGRSYSERIDAAKTERELSEIFEDFIGMVPMGKTLFAGFNPVRTGGPMQVSIAFAESLAAAKPYPYPVQGSIRHEVFTRRGGLYFGIAHLLDYPAAYEQPLYRFADFNAGRYASRNAALQNAISVASGIPLALDGDLVRRDGDARSPGSTELAARVLADRLGLGNAQVRSALEQGEGGELEGTALYQRVFALADRLEGRPLPRAVVPRIELHSPKITRKLTTAWFAARADERHRRCLSRRAPDAG
jgi:hypothetical protein